MEAMILTTEQAQKIYVQLLNEGTAVWRPTLAENIGDGLFRILPTPKYNPDDEAWEFTPGSIVRLEEKTLSSGRVLVAIKA